MRVTTFEFDGRNEQEVINVTKMLKELFSSSSDEVSAETHVITPKKEEKPVAVSETTSTAVPTVSEPAQPAAVSEPAQPVAPTFSEPARPVAPTFSETTSTAVPTFSEPTKTEPAKADTGTKGEAPTLKEMQHLVISSVRSGHVTHDEMSSILLEFGGTSLSKVNPSKFGLLKQRIENYPLTR